MVHNTSLAFHGVMHVCMHFSDVFTANVMPWL
jgi:hypothetical protein